MSRNITQNELIGRATGSLFFTGFGAIWIALALYVKQLTSLGSLLGLALGLSALVAACLWLMKRSREFPKLTENKELSRQFRNINLAQWIAAGIVCFTLARLHLDRYVTSAVTTIVGLHLFPLAKLFRYPMHYVTAIALVVWAGLGLLIIPIEQLQGTTALGTGIILWLSAAISLAVGFQLSRPAYSTGSAQRQLGSR